ncbi:MAG: HNH endonuclease, partial [Bdellovibrionaceae bacterium]|nr:HNH endonuclease [Pseudobdellovibrionaceae bacterium]
VNPQVINKVQDGSLNLTQLIKVGQCMKHEEKAGRDFTAEQSDFIFEQIENTTIFETEKVLAVEMDFTPKKHQKITPQSNDTVTALMIFTSEEYELMRDAENICEHQDSETGERCCSQFCLQVDHIIPFEHGGPDRIQNLRILCGFHNRARNVLASSIRKTS